MPKNFVPNTPLYFSKTFEFPKDFSRPTFLSEKSRQKNFAQNTPLHFGEAFEVPRNFSRKVSCVRVWGGQPQHSMLTQKSTAMPCFLFYKLEDFLMFSANSVHESVYFLHRAEKLAHGFVSVESVYYV